MLNCKLPVAGMNLLDSMVDVEAKPVDKQLVSMCREMPECVQVRCALSQFKWCIQNSVTNEDFLIIREFLVDLISEGKVKNLEVMYER